MNKMWKVGLAMVAVIALAGAAVGFVAAQEDSGVLGGERLNNFIERLAGNLGITQDELEAAIDTTQLEVIDEALADGNITEEQAANARERVESGEPGFFGRGFHGRGFGYSFCMGVNLEGLADLLGVESSVITDGLEADQSLAQIAEANGVTAEALTDYLLGEIEAKLAEAVESGRIDQAKADEILANAPAKIEEMINREGLPDKHGGPRGAGFHPGGFGRFPGGFPEGDSTDVTEAVFPTF